MHEKRSVASLGLIVLTGVLTGLWGCGGSESSTTPSALSLAPDAEVIAAMDRTLQDEYHAESIYLGVLADFGDQRPFANVVRAEQRHSQSILRLYGNHGLVAPGSLWTVGNVPHFDSVAEACTAAVSAELENVALYDTYMALDLPRDVRNVFENNRVASLERHLPAFQACSCQTCPAS